MTKIQYQVRAAARSRGRPKIGPEDVGRELELYAQGFSMREVASALKMDAGAVRRRLKAGGAAIRTRAVRRSRLERLDQERLFGDIAAFGVSATAARYSLNKRTLQYYLAGLRRALDRGKRG
jgi:DNA-binding transcriptional ArsR family regulator